MLDFVLPRLWPPNSLDLNPVDCNVCSVVQEKVCQHRINDADELRECIVSAWDGLDQRVIDMAVRQAVVNSFSRLHQAQSGYFEHNLP